MFSVKCIIICWYFLLIVREIPLFARPLAGSRERERKRQDTRIGLTPFVFLLTTTLGLLLVSSCQRDESVDSPVPRSLGLALKASYTHTITQWETGGRGSALTLHAPCGRREVQLHIAVPTILQHHYIIYLQWTVWISIHFHISRAFYTSKTSFYSVGIAASTSLYSPSDGAKVPIRI